jgi:hypothetical protein
MTAIPAWTAGSCCTPSNFADTHCRASANSAVVGAAPQAHCATIAIMTTPAMVHPPVVFALS